MDPVILGYGEDDVSLIEEGMRQIGIGLSVIEETDPIRIKAGLGRSRLVFASRFHALVGALSQGVPSIGISWSHKFEMLFADFECPGHILPVNGAAGPVNEVVARVVGGENTVLVHRIRSLACESEAWVHAMWARVDQALGLSTKDKGR